MTFWHRFDLEFDWDGGVLEVSTNGGASYVDITVAGGVFVTGGYTKIMANGPLAARGAWTGRSPGLIDRTGEMTPVSVDIGSLAGQTAIFRWRLRTDDLTVDEALGWWVDDIEFNNLLVAPPCNNPPWANNQSVSTDEDNALSIVLTSADDGDTPVTYAIESGPSHGTLSGSPPNVTYSPAANYHGSDSFTFRADDGAHRSNVATVNINVISVNDAPTAALSGTPTAGNAPLRVTFNASASSDVDGDAIASYRFNFGDGSSEVTQPTATVSHVYNSPGSYNATVVITDSQGAPSTNVANSSIQVREAPIVETIEDNDSRINYSSAWHRENDSQASAGHFRYHTGKSQNQSARLNFVVPSGKIGAITYYFARSKKGGKADVYLDGVKMATVSYRGVKGSTKSPEFNNSFNVSYGNLQPGTHKLELKNLDDVVYLDRFVLESAGSTTTATSVPGETTNQPNSPAAGEASSTTYEAPPNAQSVSIFAESSANVPFQLVLVNANGITIETVNASDGMATIIQPVTQGGIYVIKVVNLNLGPLQFTTTVTPLIAR